MAPPWRPASPDRPRRKSQAPSSTANTPCSSLRAERPRQQSLDCFIHGGSLIENGRDRACDRHLDAFLVRHLDQDGGGEGAFRQLSAGLRRFGALTFAEREAERKVARLRTRTRENEVAEAGKTRQGFRPRAERF